MSALLAGLFLFAACVLGVARASAATTFTIGGALSGLKAKESITLLDNGGNALKLTANGAFHFSIGLAKGKTYKVTVSAQPLGQLCTVSAGTGPVGSANISSVKVACANTYSIGGAVTGLLPKESVTLTDNATDVLKVSANGKFTFARELLSKAAYLVKVSVQPAGEECSVTHGSAHVGAANITNVAVSCARLYTVGGTVSGLTAGKSITLTDNTTDVLKVGADGKFTFKKELLSKAAYLVKVSVPPTGENCVVTGGAGQIAAANVTGVTVTCTANAATTYSIGGSVSGLTSGQSVTLLDNGKDSITVSSNTMFTFPTKLASKATYSVTVGTQPTGETCTVGSGAGTIGSADVTNVAVSCTANAATTYSVGGSVSGLTSGQSVTLLDNGKDSTTVSSNTKFTFPTKLASKATYSVTVGTQPTGETCTVGSGAGTVGSADVTNVAVSCTANSGGGGSTSFWLPYQESPANSATDGKTGLILVPTGKLTSSPAPTVITTQPISGIGPTFDYTAGSGGFTFTPGGIVYYAPDKNGNQQVYFLSLAASATTPVPIQLGNAAVSSTQTICNANAGQTKLSDPTSVFVLLEVGAISDNCDPTVDTFEIVDYNTPATQAPTVVSVQSTSFDALYSNGALSGLLIYEYTKSDIKFFTDDTFTHSTTLFTNVSDNNDLSVGALAKESTLSSEGLYTVVSTVNNTVETDTLYFIGNTGAATKVLSTTSGQFDTSNGAGDDNNIYFSLITTSGATSTDTLYQVPAGGTTTKSLYSKTLATGETLKILGSNDSVLVFQDSLAAASQKVYMESVPVGATTSTPSQLTTAAIAGSSGTVRAFMAQPLNGSLADSKVFVDVLTANTSAKTYSWSSFALSPGSTVTPAPTADAYYGSYGELDSSLTGGAFQITGITDTTPSTVGGGVLYQTDVSTLENTAFTTTGGGSYKAPAGYEIGLFGISSSDIALGYGINSNENSVPSTNNSYGTIALPADLTKNFLYTVEAVDTDVTPLL